jgi:hypothetical protein
MTAPAAAPSSAPAPVAPPAPRVSSQPAVDAHAFAAMLDSLPSAAAKAGEQATKQQHDPADEPQQDQAQHRHGASHSLMGDGALLMSLPLALRAAAMTGENQAPATNASQAPTAATQALGPKDNNTSPASGKGASVGRLIGERAFHFAASAASFAAGADPSAGSAPAVDFAQAEVTPAKPESVPSSDNVAAPVANLAAAAATNRASPARGAAHEAVRSARKAEVSAPQPATREANPAAAIAPPESSGSGKAPDDRPRDAGGFTAPPASQISPFGAQLSASLAAGSSFATFASTAGAAAPSVPTAATAVAPSAAPAAPPVKEIDVDLSPGGLEDVSMTMRLAGDKLSVVIRAGSSQTLSSIEGARDAIADRLAAIGQPLDSLIVKQTGLNADGNTNANMGAADDSSTQSGGGRDGSNDAGSSRRGAGRDRSF